MKQIRDKGAMECFVDWYGGEHLPMILTAHEDITADFGIVMATVYLPRTRMIQLVRLFTVMGTWTLSVDLSIALPGNMELARSGEGNVWRVQ